MKGSPKVLQFILRGPYMSVLVVLLTRYVILTPICDRSDETILEGNYFNYKQDVEMENVIHNEQQHSLRRVRTILIHLHVSRCLRKHFRCLPAHTCTCAACSEKVRAGTLLATTQTAEVSWCLLGIIIQHWKLSRGCQELTSSYLFSQPCAVN